jgi:transcriptional regulator with GAF, ATPase, and Fis domain
MSELTNLKKEVIELKSRQDDLERLLTIIKSVSSSLQVEEVLKMIISEAISLCHADQGSIILFDPDAEKLARTLIRSTDTNKSQIDSSLNNLLAGWVYDDGGSLQTNDLAGLFGEKTIKQKHRNITSVLSIPIKKTDKMLGVINLVSLSKKVHFAAREIQLMELLATQCVHIIINAKLHESLFQEKDRLRKELDKTYAFSEVIGNSPKLREVFSLLERIIPTDARVMIEGESGSGKELIARILHYNGPNRTGPFVAVDCGAFPENLLESELFGYVKGAFTGASQDKPGLFEEAHNGTLFLDEITNMPVSIQSKLLRVLQEGEIRPLGSTKVKKVDVRLLSAASDNLKERVEAGTFREDLFYRLSVVNVNLPPLRERTGDILLLTNHFLKKYAEKYQKKLSGLKNETILLMESYKWPGNIRELENVVERMVILVESGIDYIPPKLLPEDILSKSDKMVSKRKEPVNGRTLNVKEKKAAYEKDMILKSLQNNNWNQSSAALELGLHESTLRYRMRKFGINKR